MFLDVKIVKVLLPFFNGGKKSTQLPLFAGVVGAMSSGVSLQAASFLQIFKIPQVCQSIQVCLLTLVANL